MTIAGLKQFLPAAAIVIGGFVLVFFLSSYLEKNKVSLPESYQDRDLSLQGKRLKGFMLGAEGLVADWYWMESLQYIGKKVVESRSESIDIGDLRSLNPRLLYPMLDNATTLDPKFTAAYSYGAIVLPAIDAQLAIALTKKGIANDPGNWRFYQYLGYIYWQMKDYQKAAETYETGSHLPGAPVFMEQMIAVVKSEGGDRNTARKVYQHMIEGDETNNWEKDVARARLLMLDSLDERDVIDAALDKAKSENGCPQRLSEIIPRLKNVTLPGGKDLHLDASGNLVDPSGAPYLLDRETCKTKIDITRSKVPQN